MTRLTPHDESRNIDGMTNHAAVGDAAAQHFADEVRAELARQKKTATDMAVALDITQHTAGRRLNGEVPFNVVESIRLERWLGLGAGEMSRRAERALAVAS